MKGLQFTLTEMLLVTTVVAIGFGAVAGGAQSFGLLLLILLGIVVYMAGWRAIIVAVVIVFGTAWLMGWIDPFATPEIYSNPEYMP